MLFATALHSPGTAQAPARHLRILLLTLRCTRCACRNLDLLLGLENRILYTAIGKQAAANTHVL